MAAIAAASVVLATVSLPTPLRVLLGSWLVFVLPGWALVQLAYPRCQLSPWDRVVATVGLSLVISTCSAVLLAATPVGLSRASFALLLGGITVVFCVAGRSHAETAAERRGAPS